MQKVYVTEDQKEKFMEKVNRDVEVGVSKCDASVLLHGSATQRQHRHIRDAPLLREGGCDLLVTEVQIIEKSESYLVNNTLNQ